MNSKKSAAASGGRTAFRLVIEPGAAKVRKKTAPAGRCIAPDGCKKPRFKPDWLEQAYQDAE